MKKVRKNPWRGSYAIPITPFHEDDTINYAALEQEFQFLLESGVGAVCYPVLVSEFDTLSEAERLEVNARAIAWGKTADVPVIVSVSSVNTNIAVHLAAEAERRGADMVIAMPPYTRKADFSVIREYYSRIDREVSCPIMIQNHGMAGGLTPEQIRILCEENSHISWIKQELDPEYEHVYRLMQANVPGLYGLAGGFAGEHMLEEYAMGAKGIVHSPQFADYLQYAWNLLDDKLEKEGREAFFRLQPGISLERKYGVQGSIYIMQKRGILPENIYSRLKRDPLPGYAVRALDEYYDFIEPYLIWKKS